MTDIVITSFITIISIALFFIGIRQEGKYLYVSTGASIMLMILGIVVLTNPIQYESGATIETIGSQDVIQYTYTSISTTLNMLIGLTFTILGFGAIIVSMNIISENKYHKPEIED